MSEPRADADALNAWVRAAEADGRAATLLMRLATGGMFPVRDAMTVVGATDDAARWRALRTHLGLHQEVYGTTAHVMLAPGGAKAAALCLACRCLAAEAEIARLRKIEDAATAFVEGRERGLATRGADLYALCDALQQEAP